MSTTINIESKYCNWDGPGKEYTVESLTDEELKELFPFGLGVNQALLIKAGDRHEDSFVLCELKNRYVNHPTLKSLKVTEINILTLH